MFYYGYLAGGSGGWHLPVLVALVALAICIARNAHAENFKLCATLFLAGLAAVHFFGLVDIAAVSVLYWKPLLFGFMVYLVLGFPWVYYYEWDRFLEEEYALRQGCLDALGSKEAAEHPYSKPIRAREHKGKIIGWMIWWPMMLIYTVFVRWLFNVADLIVKFWKRVYERLVHVFQQKANDKFQRCVTLK